MQPVLARMGLQALAIPTLLGHGRAIASAAAALSGHRALQHVEPNEQHAKKTIAKKVGWIGLGRMGHFMLENLIKSGHHAVIYDSNPHALERVVKLGSMIETAKSPADLAATAGVSVLFTMLPDPKAVQDVYLGPSGLLAAKGGPVSRLMVDCSTVDPPLARKIAAAAGKVKLHPNSPSLPGLEDEETPVMVDAPVTGGVFGAAQAHLSFMVGGETPALEVAKPYLMRMGHSVTYCGDHGSGQSAKLCNTLAVAGIMAATCEALALARRLGVEPVVMSEVLKNGAASSWIAEQYNPVPGLSPGSPPSHGYKAGMSVDGIIDQLEMVVQAGEHSHSPVPIARYMGSEIYKKVRSEGLGDKDFSSIYRYYYGSGASCEEWQGGEKLFNAQVP